MTLKRPRFLKRAQIYLRISGKGNFGVGITNPWSEVLYSLSLLRFNATTLNSIPRSRKSEKFQELHDIAPLPPPEGIVELKHATEPTTARHSKTSPPPETGNNVGLFLPSKFLPNL